MKRRLSIVVAAGLVLLVPYVVREPLLRGVGEWLDVGVPPQPADAVLVLPGDQNARPFVAAAIVNSGLAARVFVPKVERSPSVLEGVTLPSDEQIRLVLLARGVPENKIILLEGHSTSTVNDLESFRRILDRSNIQRVLVVTSHYHTRRSRMLFARYLGNRIDRVSFVSAPTDDYRLDNWWKTQEGFQDISTEYVKLVYYWLRDGSGAYWMAAAIGILALVFWRRRRKTIGSHRRTE